MMAKKASLFVVFSILGVAAVLGAGLIMDAQDTEPEFVALSESSSVRTAQEPTATRSVPADAPAAVAAEPTVDTRFAEAVAEAWANRTPTPEPVVEVPPPVQYTQPRQTYASAPEPDPTPQPERRNRPAAKPAATATPVPTVAEPVFIEPEPPVVREPVEVEPTIEPESTRSRSRRPEPEPTVVHEPEDDRPSSIREWLEQILNDDRNDRGNSNSNSNSNGNGNRNRDSGDD